MGTPAMVGVVIAVVHRGVGISVYVAAVGLDGGGILLHGILLRHRVRVLAKPED